MKPLLSFFFLFLPFTSCQSMPRSHLRPQGLQGQQVAFYHMLERNSIYDGDLLCVFKNDGHYVGLLDGQEFDFGEYKYEFSKDLEHAKLIFSSMLMGEREDWVYQLCFTTPYSGHWKLIQKGNLTMPVSDTGDFRYLR